MTLAMHPQQYSRIYAGGHDLGILRSNDFGRTWQRSDQGIPGGGCRQSRLCACKRTMLSFVTIEAFKLKTSLQAFPASFLAGPLTVHVIRTSRLYRRGWGLMP